MLFPYPVVLVSVLEVIAVSSVCFQGFNCFLASSITTSIYIQSRSYRYISISVVTPCLSCHEIPGTLNSVAYDVEEAAPI